MSVNKFLPHLFVLPEDDANRQVANGFVLHSSLDTRRMQILDVAGGWGEVLKKFVADHVAEMKRHPNRYMVLLIDFDGRPNRLDKVTEDIPAELRDRVFVIGCLTHPEELRQAIDSFENIGKALADDCFKQRDDTWSHQLLLHNASELDRLRNSVRSFLFSAN